MALYQQARPPHPITDHRIALENRRLICEVRGYCGPFVNREYYDSFPDPIWHGTGECAVCCNTCSVDVEAAKEMEMRERTVQVYRPAPTTTPPSTPAISAI